MTDERRPLGGDGLEPALIELGRRLDYPPTPDVAAAVRARLVEQPARLPHGIASLLPTPRRLAALAALLLLFVLAAVLALSPDARTAVADRLGLRGVRITSETPVPVPTRVASPTGAPAVPGQSLGLGQRVSLDEARARRSFRLLLPSLPELGAPDAVYVQTVGRTDLVSLVYAARPGLPETGTTGAGLVLTEFQGSVEEPLIHKGLLPDTRVVPVTVNGASGYWIEGGLHVFMFRDTSGGIHDVNSRLAGNTLLWTRGDVTLRLESALSMEEALRIAESIR